MNYDEKCNCCDAKLNLMYSGKSYIKMKNPTSQEFSNMKNLFISVENGNPWMAISMEKVPKIIESLQEAYKEYQEVQKELKIQGKLENLTVNKANLSA